MSHWKVMIEELSVLFGPHLSPLSYVATRDPLTTLSAVTLPKLVYLVPFARQIAEDEGQLLRTGGCGSSEWQTLTRYSTELLTVVLSVAAKLVELEAKLVRSYTFPVAGST